MDRALRESGLPPELVDAIARLVHRHHLRAVLHALVHNTVWIKNGSTVSFMICDEPNYYRGLVT
jgi:hypothetical protein